MNITALGPDTDQPDTVEINYNYLSFKKLLKILQKLDDLKVLWKKSWMLTDDYWAEFEYKGYLFYVDSPYVDYWIHKDYKCPNEVFYEIIKHLERHEVSWLREKIVEYSENKRKQKALHE